MANPSTRANVILSLVDKMSPKLKKISSGLDAMAVKARRAGQAMAVGAIALGFVIKETVSSAVELDTNMRKVAARSQEISTKELKELNDYAKELGRTTSFSAGQVSALMAELARGGLVASEIDAATKSLLAFAKANGISAEQAAIFAVGTTKAFELDVTTANLAHTTDVLTFAANNSMQTVEELGFAMDSVSATAMLAGQSMEATAATIAIMANSNVKGSKSGRMLKNVMLSMASKGGDLAKVLGVDLVASNGKIKDLGQILGEFDARTKNMGDLERMALLNEAFGKLGIAGLVIGGKGAKGILDMASTMKGLEGYTQRTADIMEGGVEGTLIRIRSAFDGIKIAVGEAITPIIQKLGPGLTAAMNALTPVLAGMKGLGKWIIIAFTALAGGAVALLSFAAIATVLSVVVSALASVVSAVTGLVAAGATVTAFFAALPAVIALVAIGAAGLYTSFVLWGDYIPQIQAAFRDFFARITSGFGAVAKLIKAGEMERAWQLAVDTMELAFHEGMDQLDGDWKAWIVMFENSLDGVYTTAEALKKTLIALLKIGPNAVGEMFTGFSMAGHLKADAAEVDAMGDALKERIRLRNEWATTTTTARRTELKDKIDAINAELQAEIDAAAVKKKIKEDEAKANFGGTRVFGPDEEPEGHRKKRLKKEEADRIAAEKRRKALFEDVKYTTTTSMGSMTGGSAAALSAKMSAGLLQVAKEQLSVSKHTNKLLAKNRTDKGIWAP